MGMRGNAMIMKKEYRALRHCAHEWRYLWDRPLRVGKGCIEGLVARDFVEIAVPEDRDEQCYKATAVGCAAKAEYFDKFGEVWED